MPPPSEIDTVRQRLDAVKPAPRNPRLSRVVPYVPERMADLLRDVRPDPAKAPIVMAAGEPRHGAPDLVRRALDAASDRLAFYPDARGEASLRQAIAAWLSRRFAPASIDPETEVLPALGSREAIFALTHAVVDPTRKGAVVVCPNPLYPIYDGAAILAGAEARYAPARADNGYRIDYPALGEEVLRRTQLLFVCSPNNPTGTTLGLAEWSRLFELADRFDFVIAADECYSEIYLDETAPPLGALAASASLGRPGHRRIVSLGSLSKRSSVPGLRSGYIAGDRDLLAPFLHYRNYHGSAMSPAVQAASAAAFADEDHVVENRALYREKILSFHAIVNPVRPLRLPVGGFYFWMLVGIDDREFVRRLFAEENVKILPGSFFSRQVDGFDPGAGHVRISLTAAAAECDEGARRIAAYLRRLEG